MGVAKIASEGIICPQAFDNIKSYGSGGSVSDFRHEGSRNINFTMRLLASHTHMWSLSCLMRYRRSMGMSEVLFKLSPAPLSSTTEYRFKACSVGSKDVSIL